MIPISIVLILVFIRTWKPTSCRRLMQGLTIAVPLLELTRIFWLITVGETNWVKLLPLHLCGLQVLFLPLAVFTRLPVMKEYVWSTSILGGITAIAVPAGIVGTYPFFHFQTIQSFLLHLCLILIPILMMHTEDFHPRLIQLPQVACVLSAGALTALTVDWFWDQNYMFLREIPSVPIIQQVFNGFGYPGYWLMMAAAVLSGCAVLLKIGEILDARQILK